MDWTTIITAAVSALSTGGLVSALLYYRENKRARQIENDHKANDEVWTLVSKYKEREKDLEASIVSKDCKIDSLYKENNGLRQRNDKLSSTVAALTIMRCKIMSCDKRKPPLSMRDVPEPETENENKEKV